ncbi:hypothetical protein BDW02DRAFT_568802 [Decorospora gaudefroyi]|uniref:Uncharacterized protein n=1 Tax=Decorospora gaudefroyi TaxID=184978 RepID=A0A6A5KBK4_9PLEO|nr:hypothetical protein BDW02DRAFT_568802 [Decorospora gaudefroyi]
MAQRLIRCKGADAQKSRAAVSRCRLLLAERERAELGPGVTRCGGARQGHVPIPDVPARCSTRHKPQWRSLRNPGCTFVFASQVGIVASEHAEH